MLCCIKHCSRRVLLLLLASSCLTVDRPYGAVAGAVKESERRSRVASLSSFVRQARASGARWVAQVHGHVVHLACESHPSVALGTRASARQGAGRRLRAGRPIQCRGHCVKYLDCPLQILSNATRFPLDTHRVIPEWRMNHMAGKGRSPEWAGKSQENRRRRGAALRQKSPR